MDISSLPLDALLEIFDWAVRLARSTHEELDDRVPPLNLSHTCRLWRELVLSHPPFWAHISYEGPIHVRLASLWLERAQGADLHCNLRSFPNSNTDEEVESFLQQLSSKQSHWVSMTHYGKHRHSNVCNPTELHDLSKLTDLVIYAEFPFGTEKGDVSFLPPQFIVPDPTIAQPLRPLAPSLQHLTLHGLQGFFGSLRGIFAMLMQCPNLKILDLDCGSETHIEDGERHEELSCTLVSLEVLFLGGYFPGMGALRKLVVPTLRELHFAANYFRDDDSIFNEFPMFLVDSQCARSITKLILDIAGDEPERAVLIRIIRVLPNVTHLGMSCFGSASQSVLLLDDNGAGFFPNLQELLFFEVFPRAEPHHEGLCSMLASRFAQNEKFRATLDVSRFEPNYRAKRESLETNGAIQAWIAAGRLRIDRGYGTSQVGPEMPRYLRGWVE